MSVNVTEYESTLWHDGLRIRILLLHVILNSQVKYRMVADKADEEAHQKVKFSKLESPESPISEVFNSVNWQITAKSGATQLDPDKPDVDATSTVVDPGT